MFFNKRQYKITNSKPLQSQNKINRFISAFSANTTDLQEAAEDLIDEYMWSYKSNPIEWNECNAIMNAFKNCPLIYQGKSYPQCRGMLCEDVISEIRNK